MTGDIKILSREGFIKESISAVTTAEIGQLDYKNVLKAKKRETEHKFRLQYEHAQLFSSHQDKQKY